MVVTTHCIDDCGTRPSCAKLLFHIRGEGKIDSPPIDDVNEFLLPQTADRKCSHQPFFADGFGRLLRGHGKWKTQHQKRHRGENGFVFFKLNILKLIID